MLQSFDDFIENLIKTNSYHGFLSDIINILIVPKELVDRYKELYLKLQDKNVVERDIIKYDLIQVENEMLNSISKDLNIPEHELIIYKNTFLNSVR